MFSACIKQTCLLTSVEYDLLAHFTFTVQRLFSSCNLDISLDHIDVSLKIAQPRSHINLLYVTDTRGGPVAPAL